MECLNYTNLLGNTPKQGLTFGSGSNMKQRITLARISETLSSACLMDTSILTGTLKRGVARARS